MKILTVVSIFLIIMQTESSECPLENIKKRIAQRREFIHRAKKLSQPQINNFFSENFSVRNRHEEPGHEIFYGEGNSPQKLTDKDS